MIVHLIKIFLAGAFAVAAAMRALLSSAGWAHAHWNFPQFFHIAAFTSDNTVQLAICVLGGILVTMLVERQRAHH